MRIVPVLLAGLALATGASCRDAEPEASPPTASPTTGPTSSTTRPRTTSRLLTHPEISFEGRYQYTTEERAAIDAYVEAEQALAISRLEPVDPDMPELLATVTGRELTAQQRNMRSYIDKGEAFSEPERYFKIVVAKVQRESETRFLIESCYVSDSHLQEIATGRLLEDSGPYGIHLATAMERGADGWKMELAGPVSVSNGVVGCSSFPASSQQQLSP